MKNSCPICEAWLYSLECFTLPTVFVYPLARFLHEYPDFFWGQEKTIPLLGSSVDRINLKWLIGWKDV